MPVETVPIVLTLTFFGVWGLIGGVLIPGRRDEPPRGRG
jgi:hypothetical protein